jgi:hypothetical protein
VAPHKISRFWAFAASSCSASICSSWIYHSDWQEQIADVAADVEEPDAYLEVQCQVAFLGGSFLTFNLLEWRSRHLGRM